ncbi:MAG: hypothetical protein AAFX76_12155 [Planctomycetota bacterium]
MFSRKPQKDDKKKPARKPRMSWALAAAVIVLQVGMLGTLAVTTQWDPPKVRVIEALWAWMQQVSFYPALLLLVGGPVLTWLACRMDRKRLRVLSVSWAAFGLTLVLAFGAEAQVVLLSLWEQVPV